MKTVTVTARLDIEVFVHCPDCDFMINLLEERDTNNYNHNEEGHILNQACPSEGHWTEVHKDFEVDDVTCTRCKTEFDVKTLEW